MLLEEEELKKNGVVRVEGPLKLFLPKSSPLSFELLQDISVPLQGVWAH